MRISFRCDACGKLKGHNVLVIKHTEKERDAFWEDLLRQGWTQEDHSTKTICARCAGRAISGLPPLVKYKK